MAQFEYTAAKSSGKVVKGTIEADSAAGARTDLRRRGLTVLRISASSGGGGGLSFSRISAKDMAGSMRQLAVLVGAGLPVVDALAAMVDQAGPGKLGRVIGQVKEDVVGGAGLAEAMGKHPKVFSELMINMVKAGEEAGALETVLERLAGLLEDRVKLTGRIRSAMAYPIFMFGAGTLILIFLFTYVVPTVLELFSRSKAILPWPTRMLIALSNFLSSYGPVVGLGLVLIVLAAIQFSRTAAGRVVFDRIKLHLPLFGALVRKLVLARFCQTMATLLSSGVPLVDSLAITARVTANKSYEKALDRARERIEQGRGLAEELGRSSLFPPMVVHLTSAGERSAALDKIFASLAANLEDDVQNTLAGLLSLLEPVMILMLGGVVGFVVAAILMPIFDMTNLVG